MPPVLCPPPNLVLRETDEGRHYISSLLQHPSVQVRSTAAAHALFFDEAAARAVLEAIVPLPPFHGFNAKMVLREFNAGRLSHTGSPPDSADC